MKIQIRRAAAMVTVTVGLAITALAGVLASGASAATTPAPTVQMARACEAYRTWYYSRTTAHADAMMAATFTGTWTSTGAKYVLQDIGQLYMDIRADAAVKYVGQDIYYTGTDCNAYVLGL